MRKYQWIFTKLAMCLNIVKICLANSNGQILSIFDRVISPGYDSGGVLSSHVFIYFNMQFVKMKMYTYLSVMVIKAK